MSIQKILVGNSIVATINGKQYWKSFANISEAVEFYQGLEGMEPTDMIEALVPEQSSREKELVEEYNQQVEEAKAVEDILDFMKEIRDNGHEFLEVINNSIYLQGVNISMPELLVRAMVEAEDEEELTSLKNFWALCAMNPDPRARHDLFGHLKGGKLSITKSGLFVGYRNAQIKEANNKELVDFIVKTWIHTKSVTKKNPADYVIIKENNEYKRMHINSISSSDEELIGNLSKLYETLDQLGNVTYTDNHTRTMNIEIGSPVRQDRAKCDADPNADCSRGLHVGNKSFLSRGSFGGEGLIVLINPINVVAVPHYNQNKMRVCEYLPIGIAEYDEENNLVEVDTKTFEYDVLDDMIDKLDSLDDMDFEEYKTHEFITPEASISTLKNIYDRVEMSRDDANEVVKNRIL